MGRGTKEAQVRSAWLCFFLISLSSPMVKIDVVCKGMVQVIQVVHSTPPDTRDSRQSAGALRADVRGIDWRSATLVYELLHKCLKPPSPASEIEAIQVLSTAKSPFLWLHTEKRRDDELGLEPGEEEEGEGVL